MLGVWIYPKCLSLWQFGCGGKNAGKMGQIYFAALNLSQSLFTWGGLLPTHPIALMPINTHRLINRLAQPVDAANRAVLR